jgi:hypothetical protein
MAKRLKVSLKRGAAMTVNRIALNDSKLVYAICADKMIKYTYGSSPIVYFGTTERGVDRIATSAAYRAPQVLGLYGVKSFEVRVITCPPKQGIKSWKVLERALLLGFREKFGQVPLCNDKGKQMSEAKEFQVFSRDRIRQIIDDLTKSGQADTHEINA